MYSLYRAWFGDSVAGDSYSRLQETLSPPDTVVRVGNEGEHQFVAHKGVLAAHSGYLKALLSSAAASPNVSANASVASCSNMPATAIAVTTTNLSGQSPRPVTSVSVSSIGGEAFAPLLNYMYTGRLEVTLDNVYSVLLATHLLHMPGALEQCRAALLRLRAPPPLPTPIPVPVPVPVAPTSTLTSTSMSMSTSTPGAGSILRPIPNRLMIEPSMCWPTTPLYPPTAPPAPAAIGLSHLPRLQPSVLLQSTVPLNVSVVPTTVGQETTARYSDVPSPKPTPYQFDRSRGPCRESRQKSPESMARSFSVAAFSALACSTSTRPVSPARSVSPAPSSESQSSIPSNPGNKSSSESEQRQAKEEKASNSKSVQAKKRSPSPLMDEAGVVACNRERTNEDTNDRSGKSAKKKRGSSSSANGNESSSGVLSVVYDVACCDGPIKFHRVLNENYSPSASCGSSPASQARLQRCFEAENASGRENDENGGPAGNGCDPMAVAIDTEAGNAAGGSYTCGYCRHTFKSQYCYRKHTKRHLLPTRLNESSSVGTGQRPEPQRNRREVRLLDLNVQYYPCKICGCKFPSYYFVHKHRKLCHANERPQPEEAGGTGEDQESNTATATNEKP
nr:SH3 domain-containing protein C23A1.17 isoform X2 [Megalopta genalis]